jgi:type IV pilus assembly protein PilA
MAIRKRLEGREEGFTLIELLVVVIIIGILAAVAIPAFLNQRQRAFRAAVQSDLRNIAVEAETFFTDNQTYDGFEAVAAFTDFRESQGVTLAMAAANSTANTYCISATHTGLAGVTWSVRNNPAAGNQALDDSACPA